MTNNKNIIENKSYHLLFFFLIFFKNLNYFKLMFNISLFIINTTKYLYSAFLISFLIFFMLFLNEFQLFFNTNIDYKYYIFLKIKN